MGDIICGIPCIFYTQFILKMAKQDFKYPFRLGKKQKCAVLDANGLEVVVFPKRSKHFAEEFVEWLNETHKSPTSSTLYDALYSPEVQEYMQQRTEKLKMYNEWLNRMMKENEDNQTNL